MKKPFITNSSIIGTFDKNKMINGYVETLVNEHEEGTLPIEQVYITSCNPGTVKGPHVHSGKKWDRFICITGSGVIVCKNHETEEIFEFEVEENDGQIIHCPPGISHALVSKEGIRLISITTEGFDKGKSYNQKETEYDGYNWSKWL